ncbi:MAG TPA: putative baseplate assembly protein [Kofleriaceae bacterium]|nr:putative baseplate assembly protein [Kofleriaceae bacterium]
MHTASPTERSPERRALVVAKALNGIDWLEVVDGRAPAGVPRQRTLLVHLFQPVPATFTAANLRLDGGVRVKVTVQWAFPAQAFHDGTVPADVVPAAEAATLKAWLDATYPGELAGILVVRTGSGTKDFEGDTSTYTLTLLPAPADDDAFDRKFRAIDLTFKVECPKVFDCLPAAPCPPEARTGPRIDYLAKDYPGFRRLMLDRLATVMPAWTDRGAADLGVVLVEAMAYAADQLSYYQDAVATEAYLGTARRRVSVRRHARLLDYRMHEGTNARAFVAIESGLPDGVVLPAGLSITGPITIAGAEAGPVVQPDDARAIPDLVWFRTMHALTLHRAHDTIRLYTWGSERWWLPAAATAATLVEESAATPLALAPGDVLIFEEVKGRASGLAVDADPTRRHPVRLTSVAPVAVDALTGVRYVEVGWHPDDALPFALCVADRGAALDAVPMTDVTVARGNIVLADHGATVGEDLPAPPAGADAAPRRYRPELSATGLTYAVPYEHATAILDGAGAALVQDPRAALAAIELSGDGRTWTLGFDLLAATADDPSFVVEVERDRSAWLRFGDGVTGRRPDQALHATYRIGSGPDGNLAAEALAHLVADGVTDLSGVVGVRNPLPATGGTDPESIDQVRLYAPQAFRRQERAVTPDDYAAMAERFPGVQKAVATRRWTGSWDTIYITVDRLGGLAVDDAFEADLRAFLERYRLAGQDVEIERPILVPLDLVMSVCVAPGYFRSDVRAALLDVFSATRADGTPGFFHPDNFTFGQDVYLSQVVAAAMGVPGVVYVDLGRGDPRNRFQRFGVPDRGELEAGRIDLGRLEIARLDNSADEPENGRIDFNLEGGL